MNTSQAMTHIIVNLVIVSLVSVVMHSAFSCVPTLLFGRRPDACKIYVTDNDKVGGRRQ